eukprot:m.165817 g.165817  ORF g.165817 m.165817 type:complete len:66 (-) comp14688_c0_seq1:1653-1850(-)
MELHEVPRDSCGRQPLVSSNPLTPCDQIEQLGLFSKSLSVVPLEFVEFDSCRPTLTHYGLPWLSA